MSDDEARAENDVLHTLRLLERFSPGSRGPLVLVGLTSFATGLTEAGTLVLLTGAAVSTTTDDGTQRIAGVELEPRQMLLVALGLVAVNMVLSIVGARLIATISSRSALAARRRLLDAFHLASYERKSRDRLAALQEALTTYVDRFTAAFASLTALLSALLSTLSFAVAALVVSPGAAIALVVVGALLVVVLRPVTTRTRRAATAYVRQRKVYAEGATESVLLARELSVFGVIGVAGSRLRRIDEDVAHNFRTSRFLFHLTPRIYQNVALALAIGALFAISGIEPENLASVGAVVLLLVRSLSYGQQLLTGLQQQADHRSYLDSLVTLLDGYESEPRHVGRTGIGPIREIVLDGVGFAYGSGNPALRDVSFSIRAGETIGVLGPSGAGKSTFVNVLLRLYEPTSGAITVNGVPLREADDEEWHGRTAIVPQDPRLLHGTVEDNVRFLRDIDRGAVETAAAEAHILDFIRTLPDGLDAPVGELGMGLSGGQRQRICIARALAGRPDLLVLDEPTSALDGDSEAAIQTTLEELKGRVTMVVVAHRLSTLTICDRLVVFKDGTLADIGTPEELMASSTYYREALRLAGL